MMNKGNESDKIKKQATNKKYPTKNGLEKKRSIKKVVKPERVRPV